MWCIQNEEFEQEGWKQLPVGGVVRCMLSPRSSTDDAVAAETLSRKSNNMWHGSEHISTMLANMDFKVALDVARAKHNAEMMGDQDVWSENCWILFQTNTRNR